MYVEVLDLGLESVCFWCVLQKISKAKIRIILNLHRWNAATAQHLMHHMVVLVPGE